MAKCMVSSKPIATFQYVSFTEGPPPASVIEKARRLLRLQPTATRTYFCRFDHLPEAVLALPVDFRDPIAIKWNPGPRSDRLGLELHSRLANRPLRALPGIVRVTVLRAQLPDKLRQILEARSRLLND